VLYLLIQQIHQGGNRRRAAVGSLAYPGTESSRSKQQPARGPGPPGARAPGPHPALRTCNK
jgi:hypothetical protein